MVATISELSNPQLAQLFNAITGQTVSRFTDRKIGMKRIAKALEVTNTDLRDALEMAGLVEADAPRENEAQAPALETVAEAGNGDLPDVEWTPPKREKAPRKASQANPTKQPREGRLATVLGLLRRPEGVTVAEIQKATGWLPHTTRAYLSKGGAAGRAATIMTEKVERDGKKVTVYSVR